MGSLFANYRSSPLFPWTKYGAILVLLCFAVFFFTHSTYRIFDIANPWRTFCAFLIRKDDADTNGSYQRNIDNRTTHDGNLLLRKDDVNTNGSGKPNWTYLAQPIVALIGGFGALLTFIYNYRQKHLQFERSSLETRFKDIQDRFASADIRTRAVAALQLAEMAETPFPGRAFYARNNLFFRRAAQQFALAMVMETNADVRNSLREAVLSLTRFARGKSDESLLDFLLERLANANYKAYLCFVRAFAQDAAASGDQTEQTQRRHVSAAYFCDDENTIGQLLDGIRGTTVFKSNHQIHLSHIGQMTDDEQRNESMGSLVQLQASAAILNDTRDSIAEILRIIKIKREFDLQKKFLIAANLETANLQRAKLQGTYLIGANLQGAHLQGANLQGAYLQGAHLQGANLQGAYLQGAHLQGAYLQGAHLQDADLQRTKLQGAHLQDADLQRTKLQGANLQGAYLQEAKLQGAKLRGTYLPGAYLRWAYLRKADLRGANLQGAKLQGADLLKADLEGADLREADLEGADLQEAKLQRAYIFHSNIDMAVNVPQSVCNARYESYRTSETDTDLRARLVSLYPAYFA